MHQYVLSGNAVTAAALWNPWLYAVYGGLAAVLLGGITAIQNLNFTVLINKGTLESALGSKLTKASIELIKNS